MGEAAVEVVVLPEVGHRRDAPAKVVDRLLEAALMRQVREAVAEMPLAEHRGAVAIRGKDLGHRRDAVPEERPPRADRRGTVVQRIFARHELTACRRAHRRDVEVGQPDALIVEPVEVRRLEHRIAMARQVAIAVVVGQQDDDVRAPGRLRLRSPGHSGESRDEADQQGEVQVLHRVHSNRIVGGFSAAWALPAVLGPSLSETAPRSAENRWPPSRGRLWPRPPPGATIVRRRPTGENAAYGIAPRYTRRTTR